MLKLIGHAYSGERYVVVDENNKVLIYGHGQRLQGETTQESASFNIFHHGFVSLESQPKEFSELKDVEAYINSVVPRLGSL